MVEFGTLVAAIATLATSLGSLQATVVQRLAGSDAAAVRQAIVSAKGAHVSTAGTREAYRKAPYAKPALRYLYATGWVAGTAHPGSCVFAGIDVRDTIARTIKAIRGSAPTMRALRKLHLTAVQAGNAYARGFVSAC